MLLKPIAKQICAIAKLMFDKHAFIGRAVNIYRHSCLVGSFVCICSYLYERVCVDAVHEKGVFSMKYNFSLDYKDHSN